VSSFLLTHSVVHIQFKVNTGTMTHSNCEQTCQWQIKLSEPLSTSVKSEHFTEKNIIKRLKS